MNKTTKTIIFTIQAEIEVVPSELEDISSILNELQEHGEAEVVDVRIEFEGEEK